MRRDHYTLGLSAVHDRGRAGGESLPVILAHVDGTAVVVLHPGFELHVLAKGGSLLHPKVEGTLHLATCASLGMGVDNAR